MGFGKHIGRNSVVIAPQLQDGRWNREEETAKQGTQASSCCELFKLVRRKMFSGSTWHICSMLNRVGTRTAPSASPSPSPSRAKHIQIEERSGHKVVSGRYIGSAVSLESSTIVLVQTMLNARSLPLSVNSARVATP